MQKIKSFLYNQDGGLRVNSVVMASCVSGLTLRAYSRIYQWVDTPDGHAWCELEPVPEDLMSLAAQLGPRALALLTSIAARLVKGAKEHGDFAAPKELCREALEEHLDAVVYLALELQQAKPKAPSEAQIAAKLADHLTTRTYGSAARVIRELYKIEQPK